MTVSNELLYALISCIYFDYLIGQQIDVKGRGLASATFVALIRFGTLSFGLLALSRWTS